MEKRPTVPEMKVPSTARTISWYQGLFNHLDYYLAVVDANGCILEINQSTADLIGIQPQAAVGVYIWNLPFFQRDPSLHSIIQPAIDQALADGNIRQEITLIGDNGQPSTLDLTIKLLASPPDSTPYLLFEGRDITEKKIVEEALHTRDTLLNLAITGAPISLFLIDSSGIVRYSAGRGTRAIRELVSDPIGRSIHELYSQYPQVTDNIHRAMAGEEFEDWVSIADLYFYVHYQPLRNDQGEIIGVVGISTDLTKQKQAEEALTHSQARFETIFKEAGIGIVLKDLGGYMTSCNPAFEKMLGYKSEELKNRRYVDITYEADRAISQFYYQQIMDGKIESYHLEKRYVTKQGSIAWARMTSTLMRSPDNKPMFVIGMVEDVTARKEMEAELIEVQRRLLQARENERLRLAQDLHDGPLQDIVGLSFILQSLHDNHNSSSEKDELVSAIDSLKKISSNVRAICADLRPPALAPFGLEKAIRSRAESFQAAHPDIQIILALTPDGQSLDETIRLTLYRVFQEALNNIVRHANASQLWVRLLLDKDQVVMEVQDNGTGFNVPDRWVTLARQGHFGLVGSLERIQAIGGKYEIESAPEKGTLIRAIVPLSQDV